MTNSYVKLFVTFCAQRVGDRTFGSHLFDIRLPFINKTGACIL